MPTMTHDGASIYYTMEGPEDAPVLLLSNSLGTSLAMWEPQAQALGGQFRILRYDTRGHGCSSVPPGAYTIGQLGEDMRALLDHVGVAQAHVCGLSMGGISAMWLALHYPERVRRLVLSNTAAWIGPASGWTERAAKVERDGVATIASAVVSRWLTPDYAAAQPEHVARLEAMLSAMPAAGYAANCLAIRDSDLRTAIGAIRAPTLVISGTGDVPTPPADGRFLAAQIEGARYVELNAAHLSNQQLPEKYSALLREFFDTST